MFGLSFFEVVVIGVVALLVLGPERIPAVARSVGRVLADLRRAVDEVKYEFSIHDIMREKPLAPRPLENNRGVGGLVAAPPPLEATSVETSLPETASSHVRDDKRSSEKPTDPSSENSHS